MTKSLNTKGFRMGAGIGVVLLVIAVLLLRDTSSNCALHPFECNTRLAAENEMTTRARAELMATRNANIVTKDSLAATQNQLLRADSARAELLAGQAVLTEQLRVAQDSLKIALSSVEAKRKARYATTKPRTPSRRTAGTVTIRRLPVPSETSAANGGVISIRP